MVLTLSLPVLSGAVWINASRGIAEHQCHSLDDTISDHSSSRLRPEVTLIPAKCEVGSREASIATHGLVNTGVFLTDAWTSGADWMQDLDNSVSQDQKGH